MIQPIKTVDHPELGLTEYWYCEQPERYVVTREEYRNNYTERHIFEVLTPEQNAEYWRRWHDEVLEGKEAGAPRGLQPWPAPDGPPRSPGSHDPGRDGPVAHHARTVPWEAMDPAHADHADWVETAGRCFADHDHEKWLDEREQLVYYELAEHLDGYGDDDADPA